LITIKTKEENAHISIKISNPLLAGKVVYGGNDYEFDDVSYLTDNQKKALQKFFNNFNEEHNSELKQRAVPQ